MQHPFLDPMLAASTVAFLAIAFLALVVAWTRIDKRLEDRRERRLDAAASREIRKQFAAHIPPQRSS